MTSSQRHNADRHRERRSRQCADDQVATLGQCFAWNNADADAGSHELQHILKTWCDDHGA